MKTEYLAIDFDPESTTLSITDPKDVLKGMSSYVHLALYLGGLGLGRAGDGRRRLARDARASLLLLVQGECAVRVRALLGGAPYGPGLGTLCRHR